MILRPLSKRSSAIDQVRSPHSAHYISYVISLFFFIPVFSYFFEILCFSWPLLSTSLKVCIHLSFFLFSFFLSFFISFNLYISFFISFFQSIYFFLSFFLSFFLCALLYINCNLRFEYSCKLVRLSSFVLWLILLKYFTENNNCFIAPPFLTVEIFGSWYCLTSLCLSVSLCLFVSLSLSLYIYIYIYVYVCVCVYTHTRAHAHIHTYLSMFDEIIKTHFVFIVLLRSFQVSR